jgi:hypothetical protein
MALVLPAEVKQIYTLNYIIPTISVRLKYEKVARRIQKWWRNLIKGYFEVSVRVCNNNGMTRHFDAQLYAYDRNKQIYTIDYLNNLSELQILPTYYDKESIIDSWKNLYDEMKNWVLLNDYKNRYNYNIKILIDFGITKLQQDNGNKYLFIITNKSDSILTYNCFQDNESFLEEFNNNFVSRFN